MVSEETFVIFAGSIMFSKTNKQTIMLSEEITKLVMDQVEFKAKGLEASFEATVEAVFGLYRQTFEIETLSVTDPPLVQVAKGVLALADSFGVVFGGLSAEQKEKVNAAVREIVTGTNEVFVEALFNSALEAITLMRNLNVEVDALAVPPVTP